MMAEAGAALTDFVLTDDELCACSLEAGHPLPTLLETVNVTDARDFELAASRGLILLGKRGVVGEDFPANRLVAIRDLLLGKPLVRILLTRASEGSVTYRTRLTVLERFDGDQVIVWTTAPGGFHALQIRDRAQVAELMTEIFTTPSPGAVEFTLWVAGRATRYQLSADGPQSSATTADETEATALGGEAANTRVRDVLAVD